MTCPCRVLSCSHLRWHHWHMLLPALPVCLCPLGRPGPVADSELTASDRCCTVTRNARSLHTSVHPSGRLFAWGPDVCHLLPGGTPVACSFCAAAHRHCKLACRQAVGADLSSAAIAGLLPIDGHGRAGTATAPAALATAPAIHPLCRAEAPCVGPLLIVILRAAVCWWARCEAVLVAWRRVHPWPADASGAPATSPAPAPPSTCQETLPSARR